MVGLGPSQALRQGLLEDEVNPTERTGAISIMTLVPE